MNSLEDDWHCVFFGLIKEMIDYTVQELFSFDNSDFKVVPESTPYKASANIIIYFGKVSEKEIKRIFVQYCPTIALDASVN